MGAIVMGIILLGSLLFYAWFMFVWVASRIGSLINLPFRKDSDDEVVAFEGDAGMGRVVVSSVTRGDRRVRYFTIFLVWPLLLYLHYRFWEQLYGSFEWLFEDIVVPLVAKFLG